MGGSALLNLGVYPIQLFQWCFQQEPQAIEATGILNDDGVDIETSTVFGYGENRVGKMCVSVLKTLSSTATITGTKATITMPQFWAPTTVIDIDGTEKCWPLPPAKYGFNYPNSCGLRYEADEVRKCIRAGKIESPLMRHNDTIAIAHIEDEIRKQIGVTYPEDD